MRIVGGCFKGRELRSFSSTKNASLRPTSDRVKESVFNILTHKFKVNFYGINVLDLFAGTGSLGLEALSRGAKAVTFVERDNFACSIILDNVNKKMIWIPVGFAHGFLALEEKSEVLYKASELWIKKQERSIRWDDSNINIDWPLKDINCLKPKLSEKDSNASFLKNAEIFY